MAPAGTAKLTPRMARMGPYEVSTFDTVRSGVGHASPPRYALITSGCSCTSRAVPSAIGRP